MLWKYGEIVTNQLIDMISRVLYFVLLIAISGNACSQEVEKILYVVPDDVEVQVNKYIERVKKQKEYLIYFVLSKKSDAAFRLDVVSYKEINKENVIYWVKSTNRYVVINQDKYPLLLDYDYVFSTKQPSNIGNFGEREGYILKTMPINEGYHIDFNRDGIIK